jgi:acyl-coenzyme A synthetase/AMP-(fatty) acid ligase
VAIGWSSARWECALVEHPAVTEAAVLRTGSGSESELVAFLGWTGTAPPSLLEIKRHCAERLPTYMIVDRLRAMDELPRNRNGKIDRISLGTSLERREGAETS